MRRLSYHDSSLPIVTHEEQHLRLPCKSRRFQSSKFPTCMPVPPMAGYVATRLHGILRSSCGKPCAAFWLTETLPDHRMPPTPPAAAAHPIYPPAPNHLHGILFPAYLFTASQFHARPRMRYAQKRQ